MKLAYFKQQPDEGIADYLEGAVNLVTKFPTKEFNIVMATVRGINNREYQEWIKRECQQTEDLRLLQSASWLRFRRLKLGSLILLIPQYYILLS